MRRLLVGTLLIITVGVGLRAYYNHDIEPPTITTGRVVKGDIVETVTATGTLQAVTTVLVGTQVSGTVAWLGADFNSLVHKGEVIARLDPALLDAEIQQSEASVAKASADVDNARVQITDADQKYARASSLAARQLIPQSDLDAAKIEVDTAHAQLRSSAAQLVQARASLDQTKVNREHTIIASPINGMVISRAVDVGQTVAASLSSPTLFSIAADLTKMQVQTDVDESDIGTVQPGQPVTFTVDAYPNDTFTGRTTQVRLQPTVLQNVTTYTVMVDVPNPELKLKPGMTATAHIEVARRHDVVTVPNASLRFTPTAAELAALGLAEAPPAKASSAGGVGRVWLQHDNTLSPESVHVGLSDGKVTEIVSGDVQPGAEVVTNIVTTGAAVRSAAPAGNPFMPQNGGFGGTRNGGAAPRR